MLQGKLITVTSNTNILRAMELMTGNPTFISSLSTILYPSGRSRANLYFLTSTDEHIRHVPVFDEKVVGMISIGDVVRAIVDQQHQEVKQLKKYITGDYY